MNVQIDPAQQAFINELVSSGKFASEFSTLTMDEIKAEARRVWEARRKVDKKPSHPNW